MLSLSGILVALLQTLVVPILPAFAVDLNVPPISASWLVTITLRPGSQSRVDSDAPGHDAVRVN